MTRAVLDTNIVISGMLWSGSPKQVIQLARSGLIQPLITEAMLDELREVLARPKFLPRLQRIDKTADQVLEEYLTLVEIVEAATLAAVIVSDPDDNIVLACAMGGKAEYIVSGDQHLLVLAAYETVPILTVEQFLELQR